MSQKQGQNFLHSLTMVKDDLPLSTSRAVSLLGLAELRRIILTISIVTHSRKIRNTALKIISGSNTLELKQRFAA